MEEFCDICISSTFKYYTTYPSVCSMIEQDNMRLLSTYASSNIQIFPASPWLQNHLSSILLDHIMFLWNHDEMDIHIKNVFHFQLYAFHITHIASAQQEDS